MCGVYPDADVMTAGEEISSTYEGRHVTLLARELTHAGAVVTKGLPVVFGNAVGIALKTEVLGTDLIAVDTEGIWVVDVFAQNDAGISAVIPGDRLYINTGDCTVSKISNEDYMIPFGYALGSIDAGSTETIAVKLHAGQLLAAVIVGNKILAGNLSVYGALSFNGTVGISGVLTCNGGIACNSYLGVAGDVDFGALCEFINLGISRLAGEVHMFNLPGADPHVVGQLWNNGGVVTRSAG